MRCTKRVLIAVIASTFLAGCDRTHADDAEGPGPNSGAAASSAAPRDACGVLTESEVAALTGEPVSARRGKGGATYTKCGWFGRQTQTPYLELAVYWSGGRETWEAQRAGYAIAREMMRSAEDAELDSIVKPGPVAGLGDSAIFADLMPSIVLDDDVMLEMYLFHMPDAGRRFRALAETILQRVKE
jgi:hypothetical protein